MRTSDGGRCIHCGEKGHYSMYVEHVVPEEKEP